MNFVWKIVISCLIFLSTSSAEEYRAYDIGGNEISAKTSIVIEGEEFTLLPFSYLDIKKEDVNLDGDFTLLFGKVNGKELEPIKIASNYKFQPIFVKVFRSNTLFDETTFLIQSKEIFVDEDAVYFSIDLPKDN